MASLAFHELPNLVLRNGLSLFYPERCINCGRFGRCLCEACEAGMTPATARARCPNCSGRWEGDANCPRCFHWDALDGGLAAVDMEGTARKAVHALKYRRVRLLAPLLAGRMQPLRDARPFDIAYSVPLHRSRVRSRGFNQAEELLRELGWPAGEGSIRRVRKTATQVGLGLGERRSNVAGAFAYAGPSLNGRAVALVDDVITTGATANECARVLRDHGARSVVIFAFARANYEPGMRAIGD